MTARPAVNARLKPPATNEHAGQIPCGAPLSVFPHRAATPPLEQHRSGEGGDRFGVALAHRSRLRVAALAGALVKTS